MDKITINGVCDRAKILEQFGAQNVQICFNEEAKSFADCNKFGAAFFVGGYEKEKLRAFIGTEHLRACGDESELFAQLNSYFGIPRPLEIERKFLIEYPDLELLKSNPDCGFVEISQSYVNFQGNNFRVRKRGRDGEFIYIQTEKIKLSDLVRIEKERRITKEEYEFFSAHAKSLSKTRWLIVYKNHYFELDVFPFWQDKALLEIELKSEDEQFEIPPFINVIKEVTEDKSYRNFELCKRYGE